MWPFGVRFGETYVDKDSSFVIDSLEIEQDLLSGPFTRDVKLGPEPRVLDASIFSDGRLNS
jgi:hypothetical protein